MSHPVCLAPQCDNPPHDGFLCTSCVATLRRDLKAIPDLLADLEITISKQDRLQDAEKRPTDERPLPLRLGPMEAKRDLTDTLVKWAADVAETTRCAPWVDFVNGGTEQLAAYIFDNLGTITSHPTVGDCADEIGYAVITAQRAVDKPLQHQFVGPCDKCGADLYAHPKAATVTCRNTPCEAEYKISERREWLLEQAEDQLLTATEMSRALPDLLQQPLTASMIRNYASRGRLTQHPALPARPNEPVYRVGDVLDLLATIREEGGRPKAC